MRIWQFEVSEYDETSVSNMAFDGGYVVADTLEEARQKINNFIIEAWGKKLKLMITKLEFAHSVKLE